MRVKLVMMPCLPGPHGHELAVLQSSRPMNRAQEPRLRGGSFVAVALHATAELVWSATVFPQAAVFGLTPVGFHPHAGLE